MLDVVFFLSGYAASGIEALLPSDECERSEALSAGRWCGAFFGGKTSITES